MRRLSALVLVISALLASALCGCSDNGTSKTNDTETATGQDSSTSDGSDTLRSSDDSAGTDGANGTDTVTETGNTDTGIDTNFIVDTDFDTAGSSVNLGGFDGLDLLVVVDNSGSMAEEQAMLATAFFPLINALVNPLPTWTDRMIDNVRIAIVSSDMGLQWNGQPYSAADGFPAAAIGSKCADPDGDNGAFLTDYNGAADRQIAISEGVILCGEDASQCPPGWICQNPTAGIGVCNDPLGDNVPQICPTPPATRSSSYLKIHDGVSTTDPPLYSPVELALATSCLATLGTEGCGFEQQLVSAAVALETPAQNDSFVRENSLLVVLVVSDEEDCSIKDGPTLFASDEVQLNASVAINTACGANPETLFTIPEIRSRYRAAKARKAGPTANSSVLFAAIVGVPPVTECQGKGDDLSQCLAHEKMQLKVIENPAYTSTTQLIFDYACTREVDTDVITKASPGIRYVQLAESFGAMSYIYSICNEDWSPAMESIAHLISTSITGTCYPKRLSWDETAKTSVCDAQITFKDQMVCPAGVAWAKSEVSSDTDTPTVTCTLPRIATGQFCPVADTPEAEPFIDAMQNQFGWMYCENAGEFFSDACSDGQDNDLSGKTDCNDPACGQCRNCTVNNDPEICPEQCRYTIALTDSALAQARAGELSIKCPQ